MFDKVNTIDVAQSMLRLVLSFYANNNLV